jgi:hypothetical protein
LGVAVSLAKIDTASLAGAIDTAMTSAEILANIGAMHDAFVEARSLDHISVLVNDLISG